MLRVEHLHAGYGRGTVLHDVSLDTPSGAVHAVVGPNGAGKTTLLSTVAGLLLPRRGRIRLAGRDITTMPAHRRVRCGVALVPQGRRVFTSLTVAEHLAVAYRDDRRAAGRPWDRRCVLSLLPQLARRLQHRGGQLSGGEQQMLAIARALLTQPQLLVMDEPTEGLAPTIAREIGDLIGQLAGSGLTVLLATPQPDLATALAHRSTTLVSGHTTAPVAPADPDR